MAHPDATEKELREEGSFVAQKSLSSQAQIAKLSLQLADETRRQSVLEAQKDLGTTDRAELNSQIESLGRRQLQTKSEIQVLKQKEIELRKQRDRINGDLGKILEQQEQEKHQAGLDAHRVFFATDRLVANPSAAPELLNVPDPHSAMTTGVCNASVETLPGTARPDHEFRSAPDADHYYEVRSIKLLTSGDFWKAANSALQSAASHDALLYIHGYRTSFKDACRRAAQIAADLKVSGPVFLWSWPSRDELSGYYSDEKMAVWSSAHLIDFLKDVLSRQDLHHLHIIAHSMGNRLLESALISRRLTVDERAHLGQVVLAAPDLSRSVFDAQCDPGAISALRITLYASRRDQALRVAKVAHPFPRLGDANPDIDVRSGMDSIDASDVDTSLIGHSYIGNSRSVLADVASLIASNAAPDKRGLKRLGETPRQWWLLAP